MQPLPETAAFYLPGLIHQFGNLLLTVQGNALQLDTGSVDRLRDAILNSVQRGGNSLQSMRVLLGEHTGSAASAGEVLEQVHELARVPVRERGLSLELRGELPTPSIYVPADLFVLGVAEGLRRWIVALPDGTAGCVTMQLRACSAGGCAVVLGLELATGSLPFPLAAEEVARAVASAVGDDAMQAAAASDQQAVELRFAAQSVSAL